MQLSMMRSFDAERDDVRNRVDALEDKLRNKYGARTEWVDDWTMSIGAPGVEGALRVDPNEVRVDLQLSALLRPLRGRIEKELAKELEAVV